MKVTECDKMCIQVRQFRPQFRHQSMTIPLRDPNTPLSHRPLWSWEAGTRTPASLITTNQIAERMKADYHLDQRVNILLASTNPNPI